MFWPLESLHPSLVPHCPCPSSGSACTYLLYSSSLKPGRDQALQEAAACYFSSFIKFQTTFLGTFVKEAPRYVRVSLQDRVPGLLEGSGAGPSPPMNSPVAFEKSLKQSGLHFSIGKMRGWDRCSYLRLSLLCCSAFPGGPWGRDHGRHMPRPAPLESHGLRKGQCEKPLVFQAEVLK